MALGAVVCGCSGGPKPTPTASTTVTATVTASATVTATPTASQTPDDKAYLKRRDEAESLVLGKGYEKAIPLLDELLKEKPDDQVVKFYLMLSHGNMEEEPTPKSDAYTYAEQLTGDDVDPNYRERALNYIACANSEPGKPLPDLDIKSIEGGGELQYAKDTAYALNRPIVVYESEVSSATPDVKMKVWFLEVSPDAVPTKLELPKGTKVAVKNSQSFFVPKSCWRGLGRDEQMTFDENVFCISAVSVVVVDGPLKGKQGWFANQMDRFRGLDEKKVKVWGVKVAPKVIFEKSPAK